jgi:hypothetical protein
MVQVVGYGAVPAASARQLSPIARRSGFIRFAAAATLAVGALAAVIVIGQNRPGKASVPRPSPWSSAFLCVGRPGWV